MRTASSIEPLTELYAKDFCAGAAEALNYAETSDAEKILGYAQNLTNFKNSRLIKSALITNEDESKELWIAGDDFILVELDFSKDANDNPFYHTDFIVANMVYFMSRSGADEVNVARVYENAYRYLFLLWYD